MALLNPFGIIRFSDRQPSVAERNSARERAQTTAPVVWLLGKTGAGKTAIVSALTGDPRAVIGEGFEACTRTAAFYDVPAEAPLLRFLDTRGLGEVRYDPASDIESGVKNNPTCSSPSCR
jgi:predicted GTPase